MKYKALGWNQPVIDSLNRIELDVTPKSGHILEEQAKSVQLIPPTWV
jgi:hypothetical protein